MSAPAKMSTSAKMSDTEKMTALVHSIVMPGDEILEINTNVRCKIIIGPGLRVCLNKVVATKCGILNKKDPNMYWVDSRQKRYVPTQGETVVGVVTSKTADTYKVDIGASEQAQISYLSFEGATKKNRPIIHVGDILHARLIVANRDLESELVCVDSNGTGGKLGVLPSHGFMFNTSINLARKILHPNCPLLDTLQRVLRLPFEVAIGMNGNIWVRGRNVAETIAVANVLLLAENKNANEMRELCENIGNILAGM